MSLLTFLIHFAYIAGTFFGGVGIGYIFKEKIQIALNKFRKEN